jgi:hypothetical protein
MRKPLKNLPAIERTMKACATKFGGEEQVLECRRH